MKRSSVRRLGLLALLLGAAAFRASPASAQPPASSRREPDPAAVLDRHVDLAVWLDLDRLAAEPARRAGSAFLDADAVGRAASWCDGPLVTAVTAYFPEGETSPLWEAWAVVATAATDDTLPARDLRPLVGGPDGRPWEVTRRGGSVRVGGRGTAALLDDPAWTPDRERPWADRLAGTAATVLVAVYQRPSDAKIDRLADWLTELAGRDRATATGGLRPLLRAIASARLAWEAGEPESALTLTVWWMDRSKGPVLDSLVGGLAEEWKDELPKTRALLAREGRVRVTREADRTEWRLTWTRDGEDDVRAAIAEFVGVAATPPVPRP